MLRARNNGLLVANFVLLAACGLRSFIALSRVSEECSFAQILPD